jgi:predicted enzyme related to lactoylglutathione lyase
MLRCPTLTHAVADWTAAGGIVPNVGRMAMLADPDGVPLYVMRGAVDASSTVFRVADARHVRWNEIAAKDDEAALAFYKARFGWEAVGLMPMGEMGNYHFLAANGVNIGALMRSHADQAPRWISTLNEDIDARCRRSQAALVLGSARNPAASTASKRATRKAQPSASSALALRNGDKAAPEPDPDRGEDLLLHRRAARASRGRPRSLTSSNVIEVKAFIDARPISRWRRFE